MARCTILFRNPVTADPTQALQPSRYKLLHELGEGGAGKVFVALDSETGEQVALKKLMRVSPLNVLRFKREFRALADLRHHNLVRLYELQHTEDGLLLAMELIDGLDLLRGLHARDGTHESGERRAQRGDELRLAILVDAFQQLAQGVHAIHQAGMLHRDLKPSNVMLDREGRVVILDFGLVRELSASNDPVTLQDIVAGTPAYMAPEQAAGKQLTEASDWYAFGVMLYEALSGGTLPVEGRNPHELVLRKLQSDAPALPESAAPKALRELCARLLDRDAEQRPTAQELFAVLSEHRKETARPNDALLLAPQYDERSVQTQTERTSVQLFGRENECLQLESSLDRCIVEHKSVAVHVCGPSGSGKTALIQKFISERVPLVVGAAAAPLALRSRCYERESMPFKSIDGVADALATYLMTLDDFQAAYLLPDDIDALTALFPVFGRLPIVQQARAANKAKKPVDAVSMRRHAEEGFRTLLSSIAIARPLVIWIDDLQWGDLDSTQVLQDWLTRPIDAPVLLIFSYRSDEVDTSPCLSTLLSAAAKGQQLTELHQLNVEPLQDTDVYALCANRAGQASLLPPTTITQIVRSAHGNPFLATQLAALAHAKLARGEQDLTPLSVQGLVLHTSSLLPVPAQQLLQVLAVAGRPLAPRIALEAAEIASDQRAHIHELQTLRLVRTRYVGAASLLEVWHDRVRESVLAALSEAESKRIHRALLRVLLSEGRDDAAWLHELALGAGDAGQARHFGMLAAERASANLAFENAAQLYERCVQLSVPDQLSASLWRQLALARVHCRKGARAAEAYLKASELVEPAERIALLKLAASHLLRSGRFEEGERLVQQVLAELKIHVPASDSGLYAAVVWERTRIAVLQRTVRPRTDVVLPAEDLQLGMLYAHLALDTQCYEPLRATLFQMRATRICFQYGERETTARAYCMNAALSTLSADSAAAKRSDEMLARAQSLIAADAPPQLKLELYSARVLCAMMLGRLAQVLEPASAAEELYNRNSASGELGDYFYMFVVRSTLVSALQYLGRHREAGEVVRRILQDAEATDNRCAVLQVTMVRTGIEQAESCCRDSRARLDLERNELPKSRIGVLHVLHVMAVLRAACMTAEHDWALAIYSEYMPRIEASPLRRSAYLMYLLHKFYARLVLNHFVASNSQGQPQRLVRTQLRWLATKAPLAFRKSAPTRIQARLAALSGNPTLAAELLASSSHAHAEVGEVDEAERDRYALGLLLGGQQGADMSEKAGAALRNMGIHDPSQDIRSYYPELAVEA